MDALSLITVLWEGYNGLGIYPFMMARHFIVATLIVVIAFGPFGRWITWKLAYFGTTATVLSSFSYGLNVFHYPIMVRWHFSHSTLGIFVATIFTIALAWFGDRWLNKVLPRPTSGS